jgi:hypothetical protein
VSEKSVARQQARPVRRQKRVVGTPRSRWGLLWWRIRCVEDRRSVRCASLRSKPEIPDKTTTTVFCLVAIVILMPMVCLQAAPATSDCVQSAATGWTNTPLRLQTAPFTATFDATPGQANMDAVLGFSLNAATDFTSLAASARFNENGFIDVRNASAYSADVSVPYFPGVSYHFRLVIDPTKQQYSVYVTPAGALEIALAANYAFRSEQSTLTSLNNWAMTVDSSSGSLSACNPTIVPATTPPLPASYLLSANPSSLNFGSVSVTNSSTLPVTLTNSGNSNVSVTNISIAGAGLNASGVSTGQKISAGQSAILNVTFAPAAFGSVAGSVTIASNATNSPAIIQLSGNGVAVTHSVTLSWNPSPSVVTSYNVYRGTASGGPYGKLASLLLVTHYTDTSVQLGTTYFYVTTAVDALGYESGLSNETAAEVR